MDAMDAMDGISELTGKESTEAKLSIISNQFIYRMLNWGQKFAANLNRLNAD